MNAFTRSVLIAAVCLTGSAAFAQQQPVSGVKLNKPGQVYTGSRKAPEKKPEEQPKSRPLNRSEIKAMPARKAEAVKMEQVR